MRRFVLLSHRVPVSGAFSLNDLAGGGGRMDEIARCVSTAFLVSNALRRDTEVIVLLSQAPPPAARRIRVVGARLRHLNPDERSTAALLKNALVRSIPLPHDVEASPGILVGPVDPLAELRALAGSEGALWLTETGAPVRSGEWPPSPTIILGDADDPSEAECAVLSEAGLPRRSLGPVSRRASQCIDVVHHLLDLERPPGPGEVSGGRPGGPD